MSCVPGSMMISVSPISIAPSSDALDFLVEPVEAIRRYLPVTLDPFVGVFERRDLQAGRPPLCFPASGYQPGPLEDLQMLGDCLQADRERLGQLVDGGFAVRQAGEDTPPRRVGQRREGQAELILGRLILGSLILGRLIGGSPCFHQAIGFSCTAQSLPSGSLKKKNVFHGPPGPSFHTPSSMCWIWLASTPRPSSSARAASASATTSCRPGVRPVPMVTEQAEPLGVS